MSALDAVFRGLGKVLGSPGVVLMVWATNVVVALPAALVLSDSIQKSVGGSLVDEKLTTSFDMGWYGEYRHGAKGMERTFTPTVVGAGAFFNNLDAWFNGSLFDLPIALVGLGGLYGLGWALLLGGILHRYAEGAGLLRLGEFMSHCGEYFFRFVRLALVSGVVYYVIYRIAASLFVRIERASMDFTAEESVFAYVVAGSLFVVFLLTFTNMVFDYAKIAAFRENRRSMILASFKGLGFVLSHLRVAATFYYGLAAASVFMLFLYHWMAPGPGQSSTLSVVAAFVFGQLYLLAKLVIRLTTLSGQLVLFDRGR